MNSYVITKEITMKVLLVDDVKMVRNSLTRLIMNVTRHTQVIHAETVSEAKQKLDSEQFQFIILDIKLGKESGFDVLDYARTVQPKVKIAILTNFNIDKYRNKAEQYNADYFLDKSKDYEYLLSIIAEEELAQKN